MENVLRHTNLFVLILFSWMLNLFKLGNKRDLEEHDLYTTLKDHTASSLGYKLEEYINK